MPLFSANLSLLFTDIPFLDRFAAAAAAGFRAVEFQFPYEYGAPDLLERLKGLTLEVDLFNLPVGGDVGGERGVAGLPGRQAEFRSGVEAALTYASALGTRKINCPLGLRDRSLAWEAQYGAAVENLGWAAARLGESGIRLHVEVLNRVENPDFLLTDLTLAEKLLDDVGSPNLWLQFDMYHVQRTQGDVVATLRRLSGRIGHVQIADSPARGEPGTGELNYRFILRELDRLGYEGRVGLEYTPTRPTVESLAWVEHYGWRIDA
jgi:hydroxypyruvate isomerase